MRILLTAVNAKYIHSNLAVYSLKASAREFEEQVELAEFTINHRTEKIFGEIYRKKPDLLLFSCYIWNRREILEVAENIKKVLPDTVIWAGGPEVSWDAELFLRENPQFDGVMTGEGEETFYRLLRYYAEGDFFRKAAGADDSEEASAYAKIHRNQKGAAGADDSGAGPRKRRALAEIPGIAWRERETAGSSMLIRRNPPAAPERTLDGLPFVYQDLRQFENRIIYYESSRGCPFSCSYCLSSLEKTVRFRSLELVKKELAFFLERKVPQVKFVDRTFNCSHFHAAEIWRFLLEHDNGVTNFHFEISADLLTEEELALLSGMRPGLVQLEIGVQTVNPETLAAIHRKAPFEKIAEHVRRIAKARNIHQHLDLIAGLPFEGYESFSRSFDAVYALRPQELQLGFLKVLRGSEMQERAGEYGIVCRSEPPYEVLQTKWISCGELLRLKEIEEMLEVYYNSRQFDRTIEALEQEYGRSFSLYEALASFYRAREEEQQGQRSYTRLQRLELLREFARETVKWRGNAAPEGLEQRMLFYDRLLIQDLYLRENAKTRPAWAEDQEAQKDRIIGFYKEEEQTRRYLPHYQGRTWKQLMKMTHLEYAGGGKWLLFDYAKRDPLNYAAAVTEIPAGEEMETKGKER